MGRGSRREGRGEYEEGGSPEQGGRQLEDLKELGVPEAGGDLAVLGQAPAGVRLADLVHLAGQLGEELHAGEEEEEEEEEEKEEEEEEESGLYIPKGTAE